VQYIYLKEKSFDHLLWGIRLHFTENLKRNAGADSNPLSGLKYFQTRIYSAARKVKRRLERRSNAPSAFRRVTRLTVSAVQSQIYQR
jgi:hypothetical protein